MSRGKGEKCWRRVGTWSERAGTRTPVGNRYGREGRTPVASWRPTRRSTPKHRHPPSNGKTTPAMTEKLEIPAGKLGKPGNEGDRRDGKRHFSCKFVIASICFLLTHVCAHLPPPLCPSFTSLPPSCTGISNVLPCNQRAILGQWLQGRTRRVTKWWHLRTTVNSTILRKTLFWHVSCTCPTGLIFRSTCKHCNATHIKIGMPQGWPYIHQNHKTPILKNNKKPRKVPSDRVVLAHGLSWA